MPRVVTIIPSSQEVQVKQISCWMVLVFMAGAVPVLADGNMCTEPDAQTCLNHMAAKRTHGWLGLDFDRSDPAAIKVEAVTPYSPASRAGFRKGDVLLSLNGASLQDEEALQRAKGPWLPGQSISFNIRRGEIQKQINVTLGRYSDKTFVAMLGRHMLEYHATAASTVYDPGMESNAGSR
jgi:predicted metalloprotease with PDZ domain